MLQTIGQGRQPGSAQVEMFASSQFWKGKRDLIYRVISQLQNLDASYFPHLNRILEVWFPHTWVRDLFNQIFIQVQENKPFKISNIIRKLINRIELEIQAFETGQGRGKFCSYNFDLVFGHVQCLKLTELEQTGRDFLDVSQKRRTMNALSLICKFFNEDNIPNSSGSSSSWLWLISRKTSWPRALILGEIGL